MDINTPRIQYYIVKNYNDTNWTNIYFNTQGLKFVDDMGSMTLFRDLEDAEAFKRVLEFYGHQGLTIRQGG